MSCRINGIVECGKRHAHIYRRTMLLAEQVKVSMGSPLVTCLLEGPSGRYNTFCLIFLFACYFPKPNFLFFLWLILGHFVLNSGKTATAATIGIESDFPYVKIVSDCLVNHILNWLAWFTFFNITIFMFQTLLIRRFQLNQWLGSVRAVNVQRLSRFLILSAFPSL